MSTYSKEDLEQIAAAIGREVADVLAHQKLLENAALMFRLDCGAPSPELARSPGMTPSQMRSKMNQISGSARRLLKHLGVPNRSGVVNIEAAYDGPGDFEILKVLSWAVNHHEDPVITATRRISRLVEVVEAIEAAMNLEQWAHQGAEEVTTFGQLTVPKEHQGDTAVNSWIAAMMSTYKRMTGKEPGTSVGAPGSPGRGRATGPLIRFLAAAGKPLGIEYSAEFWRGRSPRQSDRRPKKIKIKVDCTIS